MVPEGLPFAASHALGSWEFLVGCWVLRKGVYDVQASECIHDELALNS